MAAIPNWQIANLPTLCCRKWKEWKTPIVLAQDYHFALLPKMVKTRDGDARVAIFWQIPWPNPEVFESGPWQREVWTVCWAQTWLASTLKHTATIFWDSGPGSGGPERNGPFAVNRQGTSPCAAYPISVAFPNGKPSGYGAALAKNEQSYARNWRSRDGCWEWASIGVDYTKGILERFRGIERLSEEIRHIRRRFTLCRSGTQPHGHSRYQQFLDEVTAERDRINARLQSGKWKPIVLLKKHHSHQEIASFTKAHHLHGDFTA